MSQSIIPFIHNKVIILSENTPAYSAARTMQEQEIGCILVKNKEEKIFGILTDRDLVCQLLSYGYPGDTKICEFMSTPLVTVNENSQLSQVIDHMVTLGIRRIPVMSTGRHDKKEKCVGLIALDDLIAAKAIDVEKLSQIVKNQIKRRSLRYLKYRDRKNQDSKEQKLNKFYNEMFHFVGFHTKIEKEMAKSLTDFILALIIQRMPATGAAHFISHFPSLLQETFFGLPTGPNRVITNNFIINEIMEKFQMTNEEAEITLKDFWKGLENTLDVNMVEHMLNYLPEDIRNYSYEARLNITDIILEEQNVG